MTKYCGVVSVRAVDGGGYVSASTHTDASGNTYAGHAVPVAVELVSFKIGDTFFRKIRLCQQFVSQFVHPGDNACIYVFKQLGMTNVVIGIKSAVFPSYSISLQRMLLMIFAQYLFGLIIVGIPAFIALGWISPILATLVTIGLPSYGVWTLVTAYKEMARDFAGTQ